MDFQIAGVLVEFYNHGWVVQDSWETMRRFFNCRDPGVFLVKIKDGQSVDGILDLIDSQYGRRYHLA